MNIVEKIWEQGCDEGKFGYLDRFNGDSFSRFGSYPLLKRRSARA